MKNIVFIILAVTSLQLFSFCNQHSPLICVPEQNSLEEHDLKGPIKRVRENNNYGYGSIKISEYNTEGMVILEKLIYESFTSTYIYEYDNFNRIINETYEHFDVKTGMTSKKIVRTSYSSNEKISKEYDGEKLISIESTKYEYDSKERKLSETINIKKYNGNSNLLDTSYIKEQRYYRYEDNYLKYIVEYERDRDSTILEYDSNGHRVRTEQSNGHKNIVIWDGDVKLKELQYMYGSISRIYEYDDFGRLINDKCYGLTDCNKENHVTTIFKRIYYSDNEYLAQTYREYGRYDYITNTTLDCHLQLTDEYRRNLEKDEYGNIIKEDEYRGSSKCNIRSIEYEYY